MYNRYVSSYFYLHFLGLIGKVELGTQSISFLLAAALFMVSSKLFSMSAKIKPLFNFKKTGQFTLSVPFGIEKVMHFSNGIVF